MGTTVKTYEATTIEHVIRLIDGAKEDIASGRQAGALGKLSAAVGNLVGLEVQS